jgi:Rod binding domain-containing protein
MTTHSIHFGNHSHSAKAPHAPTAQHTALVKQAQKWVSQTFYGNMLKQMRNSPFKSEIFSGGRGGQAFNEMFDQQLADRMGRGTGTKLVNALVRKIEGRNAAAAHKVSAQTPPLAAALRAYSRSNIKPGAK